MQYQPHLHVTAQGVAFRSLVNMYHEIERSQEEFEPYELLPVLVFAAFTIEAYVNSVGSRKVNFWSQVERLPWKSKVEILHSVARTPTDWGKDPLQLASQLFDIRDRLAHGKPESIPGPMCDTYQEAMSVLMVQHLRPKWLSLVSKEWVIGTRERTVKLLQHLGSLYGLHSDDFQDHSRGEVREHG